MLDCLFKQVRCKAYLKRVYDGRHIETHKCEGGTYECFYMDGDKAYIGAVCENEGAFEFLKTYYERREKVFTGFVVGFKKIIMTGYLVVDTDYHPYSGERTTISKHPEDRVNCAIVYFASGKKRYVSVNDLEILYED